MSKQLYRPVAADVASHDRSTSVPHDASGPRPISQLESASARNAREQLIRITAYHQYELRHYEPGHDVEDWLAAETQVGPPSAT
jgi:hypothetical protein